MAERPGPTGAPVVVLVHGSLDRSGAFARTQRHLEGCTVVRYDRRGYARSIGVAPSERFADQVDDLVAILDGRPAVVAGHSLGGVIALAAAHHHPELVRSVVAFEAPTPWVSWWPSSTAGSAATADDRDPGEAAERFMRRMVGDARWEALPQRTRDQRRAEGPALLAELRSIRPPAEAPYDPDCISAPVVVGHGSRSAPHHQQASQALAAALPAGELRVVEGAGHGAHLSHPEAFAQLCRRAIERAPG